MRRAGISVFGFFVSTLLAAGTAHAGFVRPAAECVQEFGSAQELGESLGRFTEFTAGPDQPKIQIVTHSFRMDPKMVLETALSKDADQTVTLQFDRRGISPMRAKLATEKQWAKIASFLSRKKNPALLQLMEQNQGLKLEMNNLAQEYKYSWSERDQVLILVISQGVGYLFYPALAWIRVPHEPWQWSTLIGLYILPELGKFYVGSELLLYPKKHDLAWYRKLFPLLTRAFHHRSTLIQEKLEPLTTPGENENETILLVIDRLYLPAVQDSLDQLGYTQTR